MLPAFLKYLSISFLLQKACQQSLFKKPRINNETSRKEIKISKGGIIAICVIGNVFYQALL